MRNNKKINIIFDARILAEFKNKTTSRSGIFFTAGNLLKEFSRYNKLIIYLYSDDNTHNNIQEYLRTFLPDSNIKIIPPVNTFFIKYYEIIKYKYKYTKNLTDNISLFLIFIPKLILNILNKIKLLPFKEFVKYFKIFELIINNFIFFSPMHACPKEFKYLKKYTILYDAIPLVLEEYKYQTIGWFGDLCKSINSNDSYFAISDYTRKDFLKYFKEINPSKIHTTLLACNETFKQKTETEIKNVKEKYNIPQEKKYIFSLSNLDPRKNMVRAVKTFIDFVNKNNIQDMIFVIGGAGWNELIEKLQKGIPNFDNYNHLLLKIGYVDDEDLPALYSGAEWFVYTSQYEGFGLPPLEAMSCGCPVITSNNSSLPEVVGDAGIMIDWDSDEQHIQAYEKYYYDYYDNDFRNQMAQKGLERSKLFSWEKCANQIIEVMTKCK